MANPNKRKGTAFESAVVEVLREAGLDAWRIAQTGPQDSGDIHAAGGWVLQAKSYKDLAAALREGVDGAQRQRAVADLPNAAAVIKRPRKHAREAYVVQPLHVWAAREAALAAEREGRA